MIERRVVWQIVLCCIAVVCAIMVCILMYPRGM